MKPLWLFDFDGVIADSLEFFEETMKKSLSLLGYDFLKSRRDFLNLFNSNLYDSLAMHGVHEDDVSKNFEYIAKTVNFKKIPLYAGTRELLEKINEHIHTGIVSSNRETQIKLILQANAAERYFPVILGHDAGLSKVQKLKKAMHLYDSNPSSTYYVTDTVGDLKEAEIAGIKSVAIGWGWHSSADLKKCNPNYFVENKKELFSLIMKSL